MVERNEGKPSPELRIAIAREVYQVLLASQGDLLTLPTLQEQRCAQKAVALADALLEALGEGR